MNLDIRLGLGQCEQSQRVPVWQSNHTMSTSVNSPLPMGQLHVCLFGGVIVVGFGELLGDD